MAEVLVFSMGRPEGDLDVSLPLDWAEPAWSPTVIFNHSPEFGWDCHVHDSDGRHVLSFPWTDHVDLVLATGTGGSLPTTAQAWEDLEQGWWGVVVPHGDLLFVAETNFDDMVDTTRTDLRLVEPGLVEVGDVRATWSAVPAAPWVHAWSVAREACSQGRPDPVVQSWPC